MSKTEAIQKVKDAKIGSVCTCPQCGGQFQKRSYQHTFCSNKGRVNCKDAYWNGTSPARAIYAPVKVEDPYSDLYQPHPFDIDEAY